MTAALLPAGQPLGSTAGDGTWRMRLGADFHQLSAGEYRLWLLAFDAVDVAELRSRAHDEGLGDGVDAAVDAMLAVGLLASVDSTDAETLQRYTVVAQGVGIGDRADSGEFVVCDSAMEPAIGVDAATYAVWAMSYRRTLAAACQLAAAQLGATADDVAARVVAQLPDLVATGAATLDLAVEDE